MTSFEKIVIGMVESVISARDCFHQTDYPTSIPCQPCCEKERAASKLLAELVTRESDRRFLLMLRQQGLYPRKKSEV